jgi:hypothetical protein
MPYAFSRISDSVSLDRDRAGEIALELEGFEFVFELGSLRELGESSRLDQGGIAQLLIVDGSVRVAHWL